MCIGITIHVVVIPITDLIMSEHAHMGDDRNITSSLVEESEVIKYLGNKRVQKTALNDWSEAVVGWKSVEIALKTTLNPTTAVKKKKVVERSTSDLHFGVGYSTSGDDYWSNSSAAPDYKIAIRCIGDDHETFPIPPWKSNIEQGTYRYIPDNGSYRTLKFMYDERKEWYTIRKKHPEKVSTAWHQTCKRMHREMKRQLKRDLNNANKDTSSKCSSGRSRRSSDFNSGDETSRSQTDSIKSDKLSNDRITEKPPKPESHQSQFFSLERTLYRKEPRARSTQSDGAVNQSKKIMNTIHESEPVTPVPQYSIPSGSQMFKSASDLFVENFSHRISALEDEIKKDAKWLRKNENEVPKVPTAANKSKTRERPPHTNLKENLSPRLPLKTETLTSDIFSVRPMGNNKDLKPLEKTRGYRPSNLGGGDYLTQNGQAPPRSNSTLNNNAPNYNYEMEKDKTTNGYKSSAENTKQSLFNTLTGTKINTQQNGKRSSKGFSTPATITICDNSSADLTQQDNYTDVYRPVTVDKKPEKKAALQNIPALLPEISGKRLEVTSIAHRLL